MAETTQIQPEKVRAYLATDYRLGHTPHDIVLTIGQRSERCSMYRTAPSAAWPRQ